MCDFSQEVLDEAFQLGYNEAQRNDSLTVPAFCEELMDLVKEECEGMPMGSSLPLFQAFGSGQATWFHEETMRFCEEAE